MSLFGIGTWLFIIIYIYVYNLFLSAMTSAIFHYAIRHIFMADFWLSAMNRHPPLTTLLTFHDPSNQGNTQTNSFSQNQYSGQGNGSGQNNYGWNNGFRSSNSEGEGTNQNRSMQNNQNQQSPSAMIANSNSNFQTSTPTTWIPDSGASFHVTGITEHTATQSL